MPSVLSVILVVSVISGISVKSVTMVELEASSKSVVSVVSIISELNDSINVGKILFVVAVVVSGVHIVVDIVLISVKASVSVVK